MMALALLCQKNPTSGMYIEAIKHKNQCIKRLIDCANKKERHTLDGLEDAVYKCVEEGKLNDQDGY